MAVIISGELFCQTRYLHGKSEEVQIFVRNHNNKTSFAKNPMCVKIEPTRRSKRQH